MAATLASGAFQGSVKFTGAEGPVKGKRMSNAATRAQLQWQPKYPSCERPGGVACRLPSPAAVPRS